MHDASFFLDMTPCADDVDAMGGRQGGCGALLRQLSGVLGPRYIQFWWPYGAGRLMYAAQHHSDVRVMSLLVINLGYIPMS